MGANFAFEAGAFGELGGERGSEPSHFFGEGFIVNIRFGGADVAAGGEDVIVLADVLDARGLAEARLVRVGAAGFPGLHGVGYLADVGFVEDALDAGGHAAEVAGVDKKRFAPAVAEGATVNRAGFFVLGEEPDAGGNLSVREELAGKGDHAFDKVVLEELRADLVLATRGGTHRAVCEEEAEGTRFPQVREHVEKPGEVCIAPRRHGVALPATVGGEGFVPPLVLIERGGSP